MNIVNKSISKEAANWCLYSLHIIRTVYSTGKQQTKDVEAIKYCTEAFDYISSLYPELLTPPTNDT